MALLSLLPLGLRRAWASVEVGTWWARSAEFMQRPVMNGIRCVRIPGDTRHRRPRARLVRPRAADRA